MFELKRVITQQESPIEQKMDDHWQRLRILEEELETAPEADSARRADLTAKITFHEAKVAELEGMLNRC